MPDFKPLSEEELKDLEDSTRDEEAINPRSHEYNRSWCSNGTLVRLIATARRAAELEELLRKMPKPVHDLSCKYDVFRGSCTCGVREWADKRRALLFADPSI